jgi:hypothetical protein
LGERICREFFEQLFGRKFPKSYPKWLVNKKGNQMELDGYCESLGLAYEHHGEHHYSVKSYFARADEILLNRRTDDRLKRRLCKNRRIVLIEVPEIPARLPIEDLRALIKRNCERNRIPLPSDFETKIINLKKAYATSGSREALREVQLIARNRGGKCLSDNYVSARTKLPWECAQEHRWEATPDNIKRGRWCPKCARMRKRPTNAGKTKVTLTSGLM